MSQQFRTVIFDLDGVVADSEPLHQSVIRVLLAEYGVDWSPDGHDPTVGMTSPEAFALICSLYTLPHDPRELDALYTARVVPVLRERVTPMPGVPEVPRALAHAVIARAWLDLAAGASGRKSATAMPRVWVPAAAARSTNPVKPLLSSATNAAESSRLTSSSSTQLSSMNRLRSAGPNAAAS